MKLTATREELLAPLQSVIGVVERRQTMPVLANVLLAVRDSRLSVTGTDLEVELVATCGASVYRCGRVAAASRSRVCRPRSFHWSRRSTHSRRSAWRRASSGA